MSRQGRAPPLPRTPEPVAHWLPLGREGARRMEAAGRRASSSGRATGPAPTCTMPTSPTDGRQRHGAKEMQGRTRPLVMPHGAPLPEVSARRVGTGQEYAPERCCREPLPRTPASVMRAIPAVSVTRAASMRSMDARTSARRTRDRSCRPWRTNGGRRTHSRTGESARLRAPSGRATECRSEQHGDGMSCPAGDGVRMRARETVAR